VANIIEIGYRAQFNHNLALSATAFHYQWDKLRSGQPPPAFIENMIDGQLYGFESWASWQAGEDWRLSAGLAVLEHDLAIKPGSTDPVGPSALGNDPDYQWMVRSSYDIAEHHQLDVLLRRVDDLPQPAVPSYTAVDLNYSWQLRTVALSLAVQNLFDAAHPESGGASNRSEYPRGVFLKLRWSQ
jgi:iron complex outermembrane receptor protein